MTKLGIKTGDQVIVLRGKDAGKKGKIIQVFPATHKVVVEGVNSMTKNVRAKSANDKGQRVQFFAPIDRSNVMFIDPSSGKPTRRKTEPVTPVPLPTTSKPKNKPTT